MNARFGFVVLTMVLLRPAVGMAAVTAWTDVTVRVYDATELPPSQLRAALKIASAALAGADVEVTWRECGPDTAGPCDTPMSAAELAIRIVRSPIPIRDARVMALGDALVDTHTRQAVLATLYLDRVQQLASAAGVDGLTLLGRALAHELGHLLAASSTHSKHGLMRALWSRAEVQRGRERDWSFTKTDVAAIQRRVRP